MSDNEDDSYVPDLSRRGFLAALGGTAASVSLFGNEASAANNGGGSGGYGDRFNTAFRRRRDCIQDHVIGDKENPTVNPRRETYDTFSRGLPHTADGEVEQSALDALVDALVNGGDFEAIPLGGDRKLVHPEAALSYTHQGIDSHAASMPSAPAFGSDETGAEMIELYWKALARDVPFANYESNSTIADAASELASATDFNGPATPDALFRGAVDGCQTGPYVPQYLLKSYKRGRIRRDQTLQMPTERDFITDYGTWLDRLNGESPSKSLTLGEERHITTGRDLAHYVHGNQPAQPYVTAGVMLTAGGYPLDSGVPYDDDSTQAPFIDYGIMDVRSAVLGVVEPCIHATWFNKWIANLRLRPEAYGGRVRQVKQGNKEYPISDQLLDSTAVKRTKSEFGTTLLPQAYTEGCPTHPSYPAGHSVIAGACTTVLKALFDADATIDDPKRVTAGGELEDYGGSLTVGGELNKLASHVSLGRDWAGIHYRSDGIEGMRVGEEVAISYLETLLTHKRKSGSLSLTTFDGDRVTIEPLN